jgi:hypothetical protein
MDGRRGLYSYEALRSRLTENTFAVGGLVDMSGPVLRLANLTPEDMFVLLTKLRHVYAAGDPAAYLLPDPALHAFMQHCSSRVGDAYFRTPRTMIREFLNLLAVLEQNPGAEWTALIGQVTLTPESNPDLEPLVDAAAGVPIPDATILAARDDVIEHLTPAAPARTDGLDDEFASFRL